ncbi:MAG: hypothetical protein H0T89_00720 [Deltaproteobacteria bacterium]|nr:hypothetical protein [Deltaproteobacteria bacterium]
MAKKTARAQPAPKPQKRRQRAEPPEPLDLEISSIGHEDPDVRRARQLAIVAAANARIAADPRAFDAALAALKGKSKSTRDAGTDDTEQAASAIISTSTDRAANVERWAALLTMFREARRRDIKIAKVRDNFEALGSGFNASETRPPESRFARPGDRVQFMPQPSRAVEMARSSGALNKAGYAERGVLEPVEWRWARSIAEFIHCQEDREATAEAYARADNVAWPPRTPAGAIDTVAVKASLEKIRSLINRATASNERRRPLR